MGEESRVVEQVRIWRDDLLGPTRGSNLLRFEHLKVGSLEVTHPRPETVRSRLVQPNSPGWVFEGAPGRERDDGGVSEVLVTAPSEDGVARIVASPGSLTTTKATARDLAGSLRALHRSSTQEFLDKGIWSLYLGFGMLEWEGGEGGGPAHSPLLLVPVRLERPSPRDLFHLVLADGEPVLNPALALQLGNELGIELPELDPEASVEDVLELVAKVVRDQERWQVTPRCVLARFSFQKEVMYQDLRVNEERIARHPIVAALATPAAAGAGQLAFDPVAAHALDEVVPAEGHPTVLDADATQRQCVEAASRGESFVMDGPPGTGKSQTIANIVAELLRAGKRVLFVSEKAAALDVVTKRLGEAGLDELLLPLHDPRMTRREVAVSLARALGQRPPVRSTLSATELAAVSSRRRALSGYAEAMNEVRQPFGRSLHEVVGRAAALHHLPQAPVAGGVGGHLDAAALAEILELGRRLARSWGPVVRGERFVWRELEGVEATAATRQLLEREVADAALQLAGVRRAAVEQAARFVLAEPTGVAEARRLAAVLAVVARRMPAPRSWLTGADLEAVERRVEELRCLVEPYHETARALAGEVGAAWRSLDTVELAAASGGAAALASLFGGHEALAEATLAELAAAEQCCEEVRRLVPQLVRVGGHAAVRFGLASEPLTLARAERLVALGRLAAAAHRPRRDWLTPGRTGALDEARAALGEAVGAVRAARASLGGLFEESVLELDLDGLSQRFRTVHRGAGRLRKGYREDVAVLEPHLKGRQLTAEAVASLDGARAWQHRVRELEQVERRHQAILGEHYEGLDTDFAALDEAIGVARAAYALVGADIEREPVVVALLQPERAPVGEAEALGELTARYEAVAEGVPPGVRHRLAEVPVDQLGEVARRALPLLGRVRRGLEVVERATGRRSRVGELRAVAGLAGELDRIRSGVNERLDADRAALGGDYRDVETDWETLTGAVRWARDLRAALGGPASVAQAEALVSVAPSGESLEAALAGWDRALGGLRAHVVPARALELAAQLEGGFGGAEQLLGQLQGTIEDVPEWLAFASARSSLVAAGMGEQVAFCEAAGVEASAVPGILERSLLEGFVDAAFAGDARLGHRRSVDRDALAAEFRQLDRQLFELASARAVQACNDRRPPPTSGAAAIILREAEKHRRHMPIRDLLATTTEVAQALKPCFLMSPLTVSQFLPPLLRFDTVIFDEASQVQPCDAINAIYRARQLIVAGDQRQLPPTSFFVRSDADGGDEYEEGQLEEFESVLDLCKGQGGLTSLPLSWHYRSRNESLISYANHAFYGGRLVTFPSAEPDGEEAGVALFRVDGVYRRGGARDNPIEAEAVVERVLEHARRHPGRSVGVVAFSEAQAGAIEVVLDRRRRELPELDGYFAEDRLNGFFVKSLESVQGDERDIIVFSVGYGRDETGRFLLNFGPLNKPGGERRLNVAVTRARRRVEIVSSVTAADFAGDVANPGVAALRGYLDFAARGGAALGVVEGAGGPGGGRPLEAEVARLVRGWGYEVVADVGQSGHRVDLGVRHPAGGGRFLLGIECDGAAYHASKVARDRDRLRPEQLAAHGWTMHHLWGSAWYHERERAELELRAALDAAGAAAGLAAPPGR